MSAGQFTCAELAEVQLKADQMWADNATRKDYIACIDTIAAVRTEQTARIAALETSDKDNVVKIAWINACVGDTVPCTDECLVGGPELEAACDTLTLDICRRAPGFTIDEKALRTSMFSKEELIAKGILGNLMALDNYLNEQAIIVMNANAGVNAFNGGKGTVSGFTTLINAPYWNPSLFSYFMMVTKMNKFSNPWMMSGSNLYESWWNSNMALTLEGKTDAAKFDLFRKYFDLCAFDAVLFPDKKTFLIDGGAMAFFSKAYYPTSPVEYLGAGLTKYSIQSKNLPGVFYDVTYTTRCVGDKIFHDFSFQVKAGIFVNPKGCDPNSTGILEFKCV